MHLVESFQLTWAHPDTWQGQEQSGRKPENVHRTNPAWAVAYGVPERVYSIQK